MMVIIGEQLTNRKNPRPFLDSVIETRSDIINTTLEDHKMIIKKLGTETKRVLDIPEKEIGNTIFRVKGVSSVAKDKMDKVHQVLNKEKQQVFTVIIENSKDGISLAKALTSNLLKHENLPGKLYLDFHFNNAPADLAEIMKKHFQQKTDKDTKYCAQVQTITNEITTDTPETNIINSYCSCGDKLGEEAIGGEIFHDVRTGTNLSTAKL